ncbi:hypothetical protein AF085_11790, partial [Listeria monocytogenes]|nr:hypothetical protein [Listeria monocytogenes]
MKLVNLEMPKTENEYGVFNVEGMPNVYYRFEMQDGIANLMEDFFADNQPVEEKYQLLPKTSNLYETIQAKLSEYLVAASKEIKNSIKKGEEQMSKGKLIFSNNAGRTHIIDNDFNTICAYIARSNPKETIFAMAQGDVYEQIQLLAKENKIKEMLDEKSIPIFNKRIAEMISHQNEIPVVKIYTNDTEKYQLDNPKRIKLHASKYSWNKPLLEWALDHVEKRLSKEMGKELSGYQIVDCAKIGFLEESNLFSSNEEALSFTYFYNQEATDYLYQSDLSQDAVFKRPIDFANKLYNYAVEHLFHDTDILLMEKKTLG